MAEKREVCVMFGEQCCTYTPDNTDCSGSFTEAMNMLKDLRTETKENAGLDQHAWDWFDINLGNWGAMFTKISLTVLAYLVILTLLRMWCISITQVYIHQSCVRAEGSETS